MQESTHLLNGAGATANPYENVSPEHVSRFMKAISPEVARSTVWSVDSSLVVAYHHPDGQHHFVRRMPDGAPGSRYMNDPGKRGLTVHPLVRDRLNEPDTPLVIIEGTRQHLAGVTALLDKRLAVVGINGIQGWRWTPEGERRSRPLPDWRYIPLVGRKVYVIPDGDYATKEGVRLGTDTLVDWLTVSGADVHRVTLPVDDPDNNGLDDFLEGLEPKQRTSALLDLMHESEDKSDDFFLSRDDLDNLPPVEPLLAGMLNKASIVWLSGKFGTYKTFLALAWAVSVATGRDWEGREVTGSGPVVYVAAEGHRGLLGRLRTLESERNDGERVTELITTPRGIDPREPQQMAMLTRKVKQSGAVLVVFDTLHRCTPGFEENSNTEAGQIFGALQRLKDETGVTILVLHHTGHEGIRSRGASSMEDDADDAYVIKLEGDPEDRSASNPRILVRRKSKEGEAGEEFPLHLAEVANNDGPFSKSGQVYLTLRDGFTAPSGRKETPIQRIAREMDEAGLPTGMSQRLSKAWLEERDVRIKGAATSFNTALAMRNERASHAESDAADSLIREVGDSVLRP